MTLPSMLTTGALSGLLVAVLSRLQTQPKQLQKQYAHTLRFLFIICAPVAIYFLLFPHDPIALLYGEQWVDVAPLLQVLSIACLTQPIHNTMGWLFTASGQAGHMLRWGVGASITLSVSFAVGVQYGVIGVAVAYSVIMGVGLTIGAVWVAHRSANISFFATCKPMLLPILIAAITVLLSHFISRRLAFNLDYLWVTILYHGSLIVGIYVALLACFYRGRLLHILLVAA